MNGDEFRIRGHELIDWIADYLATIETRRVSPDVKPGDVRAMLPAHPPSAPEPWEAVIDDLDRVIAPGLDPLAAPQLLRLLPGQRLVPVDPRGAAVGRARGAGDELGHVTSVHRAGDADARLDGRAARPPGGVPLRQSARGGVIQGSASEATLVAILSARWRATGGAINHDGDTSRLVAYASAQAHSSVEKGLRIAGVGLDRLRTVPHDEVFAMRADSLADMVAADRAAGLVPFFVCSSHGTTSSMAFDPTAELAPICADAGAWLHVDAAMSGIAALVPEHRWVNAGLEHADSYCTNPHKWMGVNFDCDLYLTSDRVGAARRAEHPARVPALGGRRDRGGDRLPRLAGPARSTVPGAEAVDGAAPGRCGVDAGDDRPARRAGPAVGRAGERRRAVRDRRAAPVEPRLPPPRATATPTTLIERANATGEVLFTRTVLDGEVALRFSIGTRTTEWRHVEQAWQLLQRLA